MNRFLSRNEFIKDYAKILDRIENPYNPQRDDFRMKSGAILHMVRHLYNNEGATFQKFLDVGCGASHLAATLRAIDLAPFTDAVALDNTEHFPDNEKYGVRSVLGDFNTLDIDEKFDLVIDCCSTHLFDPVWDDECPNIGMWNAWQKIKGVLNPGGWFVTCTDVSSHDTDQGQFVGWQNLLEFAHSIGFDFEAPEDTLDPHQFDHPVSPEYGPTKGGPIQIYMLAMQKQ